MAVFTRPRWDEKEEPGMEDKKQSCLTWIILYPKLKTKNFKNLKLQTKQ